MALFSLFTALERRRRPSDSQFSSSSMTTDAGFPWTTASAGTSSVTTAPDATTELSPTVTGLPYSDLQIRSVAPRG
ncbi:hypothetical protein C493_01639 [Natronolimnohabitans innermongolicus JCM 12255]|uniref:Uncharacterized protein n=1 Tax=Natronolimnohabitans innermongolicus JCM 12255 TaxID=1227499 RepID=L9XJJ4_9EURY|nr:hypothetical protein C493_01639 [Natronolimnohabitans innermongolicus JCM 12255]